MARNYVGESPAASVAWVERLRETRGYQPPRINLRKRLINDKMVGYRRNVVAGGSYFFTVTLADRSSRLLVDRIDDLREAFRTVRVQRPFALDAVVILPDHLHCI